MYCQKCGNELNNNEAYCPKCGRKVDAKSNVIFIVIIVALDIVIFFMLISFALFNKRNVKVDKQETTIVEEEVSSDEIIDSAIPASDETEDTTIQIMQTTQTTQATTATQTVQATTIQIAPQTTKPIVQTTVAQNMGVLQTAVNAAVSFTPPISGTVAAEVQSYQYVEKVVETIESIKRCLLMEELLKKKLKIQDQELI